MYKRSDMCKAIEDYVINSKYRDILKLRFCEGLTYEQIGEITNYSPQHIKRICTSYKELLMNQL